MCEIFLFKNHAENEKGRLVPEHILFFEKALYEVKAWGYDREGDFYLF